MLSAAPSMSAAELERRVRLQRRKLGLALQLNDLPEPIHVCCLKYYLCSYCVYYFVKK